MNSFFFCEDKSMFSMGRVSMTRVLVGLIKTQPASSSLLVLSLLKEREGWVSASTLAAALARGLLGWFSFWEGLLVMMDFLMSLKFLAFLMSESPLIVTTRLQQPIDVELKTIVAINIYLPMADTKTITVGSKNGILRNQGHVIISPNTSVMKASYSYYKFPANDFEGIDLESMERPFELKITCEVAQSTKFQSGNPNYAEPEGGIQSKYFDCRLQEVLKCYQSN